MTMSIDPTADVTPIGAPGYERWLVEGYEITGGGMLHDVELRDSLYGSPIARGDVLQIRGVHGSVPVLRREYDVMSFVLQAWYLPPVGPGGGGWAQSWQQYELLLRAAGIVHRPARWERYLADGRHQTIGMTLTQAPQPQPIGQLGLRVQLELSSVGDPFWADYAATTDTALAGGGGLPLTLPLTSKASSSAPLADLVYTITGPCNNPTVKCTSDPLLQDSFTWQGSVPSGCTLIVDAGQYTVTGTGASFAPDASTLIWTGTRFLEVPPAAPGSTPTVVLSCTSGNTAATGLSVAGKGKALT